MNGNILVHKKWILIHKYPLQFQILYINEYVIPLLSEIHLSNPVKKELR